MWLDVHRLAHNHPARYVFVPSPDEWDELCDAGDYLRSLRGDVWVDPTGFAETAAHCVDPRHCPDLEKRRRAADWVPSLDDGVPHNAAMRIYLESGAIAQRVFVIQNWAGVGVETLKRLARNEAEYEFGDLRGL